MSATKPRARQLLPWLLTAVLVLGAALLTFGLLSLSWVAQAAQAQARVAAEGDAARIARELQAKLLQASTLELAPALQRFEVRAGVLVPPAQIEWVLAPPERVLGLAVREVLATGVPLV